MHRFKQLPIFGAWYAPYIIIQKINDFRTGELQFPPTHPKFNTIFKHLKLNL